MAVTEIPPPCRVDRLHQDGAGLIAAGLAATGVADAKVQAAWLVHGYTWLLAAPALTALLGEGRVLDLSPGRVTVGAGAGGAHVITVDEPSPPPFGGCPDAARARLRETLEENLATVLSLPQLSPIGARLRWMLAADMLAGAALHVGHALLGREETIREAEALMAIPGALSLPLDVIPDGHAADHPERWRASCCLAHRVGGELCPTCPRRRPRG